MKKEQYNNLSSIVIIHNKKSPKGSFTICFFFLRSIYYILFFYLLNYVIFYCIIISFRFHPFVSHKGGEIVNKWIKLFIKVYVLTLLYKIFKGFCD